MTQDERLILYASTGKTFDAKKLAEFSSFPLRAVAFSKSPMLAVTDAILDAICSRKASWRNSRSTRVALLARVALAAAFSYARSAGSWTRKLSVGYSGAPRDDSACMKATGPLGEGGAAGTAAPHGQHTPHLLSKSCLSEVDMALK